MKVLLLRKPYEELQEGDELVCTSCMCGEIYENQDGILACDNMHCMAEVEDLEQQLIVARDIDIAK